MGVDIEVARQLTRQVAKLVTDKDLDGFAELCTEDVVFDDPAFPAPFRGRTEVIEGLRTVFGAFPDLVYELVGDPMISSGDTIGTRVHFTGTMRGPLDPPGFAPTHQPIDLHGFELYTLADDARLRKMELFIDTLELGRQIGAVPPEGSPGDRLGVLLQRFSARRARRRSDQL